MADENGVGTIGPQSPLDSSLCLIPTLLMEGLVCSLMSSTSESSSPASPKTSTSQSFCSSNAHHTSQRSGLRETDNLTVIEITDVHIENFIIFITWLNYKPKQHVFSPLHKNPINGHYWIAGMPIIELYVFACEYQVPRLAEDALCRFTSLIFHRGGQDCMPHSFAIDIEDIPTIQEINYGYANTDANSPLRTILVDAFCTTNADFDYTLMVADREFLVDVIFLMQRDKADLRGVMDLVGRESCERNYHSRNWWKSQCGGRCGRSPEVEF